MSFTLPGTGIQQAIVVAAFFNALAGAWLAYQFFNSRWWREMVIDPATDRVKAGDLMKAFAFVLACALVVAIAVAKLGYNRDPGLELLALVGTLFTYSGALQESKRREKKDAATAANPPPVQVKSEQTDIRADNVQFTPTE